MSTAKNIALFSLAYDPFFGGAEIAIQEITKRIPDAAFSCITYRFERDWPAEEVKGNTRIIRIGRGKKGGSQYGRAAEKANYIRLAYKKAEELHRRRPFTHIWGIMASYGGAAALLFKRKHPEIPSLLTLQEGDSEEHILRRVGIFYPLWRSLFRRADHIQVISSYLADFARRHGAQCLITIVPNGVDLEKFKARRQQGTIKEGPWRIITTSRLVHKNGIDILLRACALLKREHPTIAFKCTLVGSGPDEKKLRNLAAELGLEKTAEFITGAVAPSWIPHHLEHADIFVRPSRSEGLGNSFLEAMAVGLPVIGTRVGGIRDFLKDPAEAGLTHATGIFARPEDPADCARQIRRLIQNKELREHIAANGKELVRKNYSWEIIAKRMQEVFDTLA